MPIEPRLPPVPSGNLKIHAEHFRKVRDRIECTKPVPKAAGGLIMEEKEDGRFLSIDPQWVEDNVPASAGGGLGNCPNLRILTLDVCKNGQPDQVFVLGFESEGAAEICADVFAFATP